MGHQNTILIFVIAAMTILACNCMPGTSTGTSPTPPLSNSKADGSATTTIQQDTSTSSGNGTTEVNFAEIMQKCNASNPISMEYLSEFNSTGSFPDETNKVPMCYVKCYLQSVGILNDDGSADVDRAVSMLWPNSVDAIDDCLKEQDGLFDKDANGSCENAYYLARCVMIKELLATRTAASD